MTLRISLLISSFIINSVFISSVLIGSKISPIKDLTGCKCRCVDSEHGKEIFSMESLYNSHPEGEVCSCESFLMHRFEHLLVTPASRNETCNFCHCEDIYHMNCTPRGKVTPNCKIIIAGITMSLFNILALFNAGYIYYIYMRSYSQRKSSTGDYTYPRYFGGHLAPLQLGFDEKVTRQCEYEPIKGNSYVKSSYTKI